MTSQLLALRQSAENIEVTTFLQPKSHGGNLRSSMVLGVLCRRAAYEYSESATIVSANDRKFDDVIRHVRDDLSPRKPREAIHIKVTVKSLA